MKLYRVSAYFAEAPSAHAFHELAIEAGSVGLAAKRALDQIRKDKHIKGRHLSTVRLNIRATENKHGQTSTGE